MPPKALDQPIRFSVFDRLLHDRASDAAAGGDLSALRECVRRDLEWLLNTRRIYLTVSDEFPELQKSVYHYGLPDITSLGRDVPQTRARLRANIEEALALFEPRLTNVRVSLVDTPAEGLRQVRFVIHALLIADPEPVRVAFDTVVDRNSGTIAVQGEDG
jgi:type VI secretion system protein ImpF